MRRNTTAGSIGELEVVCHSLRVIPDSLIYLLVTVRAVPAESAPRGNKFARSTTSCGFWLPEMMGLIVDVILVDLISCVRIFHCVRPWLLVR